MAVYKSAASKRYIIRLIVLMSIYLAVFAGSMWAVRHRDVPVPLTYVFAVASALPIIGVFWAVMRLLIEEPDEFIRMLLVRQNLFATGFCLMVMTIWEMLQNFDLVPPGNGGFGAFFFWAIGLGLGAVYNKLTIGTAGSGA